MDRGGRGRTVIGLTGNIGTGKSTVGRFLAGKGALALDADRIAHQVIEPDGPAYAGVVEAFGPEIVQADGRIDRAALGAIVFRDPERLRVLESIVHPAVFARTQELLAVSKTPVVVIEAIKLLESRRLLPLCTEIWVVTASEETMLRRLMERRGMDADEARRRLAAQLPQEEKVRQATRVIENDGTPEELYARLDVLWKEIVAGSEEHSA